MNSRQRIQADQYDFPYHHLVDLDEASFSRSIDFGLDYFTYMRRVLELIEKYATTQVLDVGCGDGYLLCQLARRDRPAGITGVGIDLDDRAVAFAKAFGHGYPNISFEARDISTYDRTSNLITLVETLEHIPDEAMPEFLRNVDRLLDPGGYVIISVPSVVRDVLPKHFRHYDVSRLDAHFPRYERIEVAFLTARNSVVYQAVARMLTRPRGLFRRPPVRDLLLSLHRRFTADVSADRGAHIVAVYRKPAAG